MPSPTVVIASAVATAVTAAMIAASTPRRASAGPGDRGAASAVTADRRAHRRPPRRSAGAPFRRRGGIERREADLQRSRRRRRRPEIGDLPAACSLQSHRTLSCVGFRARPAHDAGWLSGPTAPCHCGGRPHRGSPTGTGVTARMRRHRTASGWSPRCCRATPTGDSHVMIMRIRVRSCEVG